MSRIFGFAFRKRSLNKVKIDILIKKFLGLKNIKEIKHRFNFGNYFLIQGYNDLGKLNPLGDNLNRDVDFLIDGEIFEIVNSKAIYINDKNISTSPELINIYKNKKNRIHNSLNGSYSLVIFDKSKSELTIARDHLGNKPLYYYFDDDVLIYASELKRIVKSGYFLHNLELDYLSCHKYFSLGFIPSPNTIFNKIKKIEPSKYIVFNLNKWTQSENTRYWKIEDIPIINNSSEKEVIKKVDEALDKAIRIRMRNPFKYGIFLSGGIDSSLVAYYASKYSKNLETFTANYKDRIFTHDASYAKKVSKILGLKNYSLILEENNVQKYLVQALDYMDQPNGKRSFIPQCMLANSIKKRTNLSLDGNSADIFFTDETYTNRENALRMTSEDFRSWLRIVKYILKNNVKISNFWDIAYIKEYIYRQIVFSLIVPVEKIILKKKFIEQAKGEVYEDIINLGLTYKQKDFINFQVLLESLQRFSDMFADGTDNTSSAISLDIISPYTDKNFVEYSFQIPGSMKYKEGNYKYILKEITKKYFGKEIAYRKKQHFLDYPLNDFLVNPLKELVLEYIKKENPIIESKTIEKLYEQHSRGLKDYSRVIWRVLIFNYIIEKYRDEILFKE